MISGVPVNGAGTELIFFEQDVINTKKTITSLIILAHLK
jgi:hypothetical protein